MAAQLYETTSGRLFHAGAVAVITVGYGLVDIKERFVFTICILAYLHVVKRMLHDPYAVTCAG